jgi:hypothetical protein
MNPDYYCPNCGRIVALTWTESTGWTAECKPCSITWEGTSVVNRLPKYPIGDEERESAFHRAKWRARLS